MNELLAREALPPTEVFKRIPYNPYNHVASVDEAVWETGPMKRNGYVLGNFLPQSTLPREPFSDFNGLIAIVAHHVAAARALLSSL